MTFHAEAHYLEEHGDNREVLSSSEDVDALLDRLIGLSDLNKVAALYLVERPVLQGGFSDHEFYVAVDPDDPQVGALKFVEGAGNWVSRGPEGVQPDERRFYIVATEIDFPPNSLVALSSVREACKEFLASGGQRPTCVQWQEDTCV